ncbi:MAG: type II toxin-antitoxin system HicB family antitoxin [Acidimicrobiales bacterium]
MATLARALNISERTRLLATPRSPISDYTLYGNTTRYTRGMSKIMVSLPEELVREIDEVARQRSMSRSALLAAAARRELTRPRPADVDDAIIRSEERFRNAGRFEAADLVRRDRGSRR